MTIQNFKINTEETILNLKCQMESDLNNENIEIERVSEIILNYITDISSISINKFNKDMQKQRNLKDFGLDSLDHVELMMFIEQEFEIQISEEAFKNFTSIDNIAKYIVFEVKNQQI